MFSFWQADITDFIIAPSYASSLYFLIDEPSSMILYLLHQDSNSLYSLSSNIPNNVFDPTFPNVELMISTALSGLDNFVILCNYIYPYRLSCKPYKLAFVPLA